MRSLNSALMPVRLAILAAALVACDKNTNKGNFIETPAEKPTAFYDSFGEQWTCIESDDEAKVTGQVRFDRPVTLDRSDVLHISLLQISADSTIELLATRCMNNLLTMPTDYDITYNPELIDPEARYVLSSVLFTSIDDETFVASYQPDGFLEVINNGVLSKADIALKVP